MKLELITRQAEGVANPVELLFVHGGFHGAWCWDENFLPWFAGRGWTSHAVSLRGHGLSEGIENVAEWSLSDYEDDVRRVLAGIRGPVAIVGHSMGGVLAQRCWTSCTNLAAMVLVAPSPRRISPYVIARLMLTQPAAIMFGQLIGNMERAKPAYVSFFFAPTMSPDTRERYVRKLSAESGRAVRELFSRAELPLDRSDPRPVLVVGGRDDWSIPATEHRYLADSYGARLALCPGAHDLMLDEHWKIAAVTIDDWLRNALVSTHVQIKRKPLGFTRSSQPDRPR